MRGRGSGNWYRWDKRDTVEGYRRLDVRQLHREGVLRPGAAGTWGWWNGDGERVARIGYAARGGFEGKVEAVELRYTATSQDGEPEDVQYKVPVTWTACHYGGARPWFLCPGVVDGRHCGRRVAVLYAADSYFLCRHCYGLAYASQQEGRALRLLHKAQATRERLGGSASMDQPFPPKPKGMHWRTYERLRAEAEEADEASWQAVAERFGYSGHGR